MILWSGKKGKTFEGTALKIITKKSKYPEKFPLYVYKKRLR